MSPQWKQRLRSLIQSRLNRHGYHVIRLGTESVGGDPYRDFAHLTQTGHPVVFDVGANEGQTVRKFRQVFPTCTVYSFEPSPTTFATLQANSRHFADVHVWNCGMGSAPGVLRFFENEQSELSSFLPLGAEGWGAVVDDIEVPVDTVDNFCEQHNIDCIDILKIDTQGFDVEVLKGAGRLLSERKIGLVFTEITIAELYQGAPPIEQLFACMRYHGYQLVTFYRTSYRKGFAVSTDALFAHPDQLQIS